jgi:hypothetical protein
MFIAQRQGLADLAAKNRLPTIFALREYTQAGGLMSYGPHYPDVYRRAATYVDRIWAPRLVVPYLLAEPSAVAVGVRFPALLVEDAHLEEGDRDTYCRVESGPSVPGGLSEGQGSVSRHLKRYQA